MDSKDCSLAFEEVEKLIPSNVIKIRELLKSDYNIIVPEQCNEFLARCLRQKDGKLDDAIRLVRGFQNSISNFKHWDASLIPSSASQFYDAGMAIPVKFRDTHGRLILILRPGLWDPAKICFDQAVAYLWMISLYAHAELLDVQRHGYVAIWDCTGLSVNQMLAVKLMRILAIVKWGKNGVGGRVKAIHLIHHPKAVDHIYRAIRPFLTEKLRKRFFLHDGTESLLAHVERECLPTFLGGTLDRDFADEPVMKGFCKSDKYFTDVITLGFPRK